MGICMESAPPFLRLFYSPRTYSWLIALAFVAAARRIKVAKLAPFALPIGVFIMCCLSPVNGAFRYSLSLVLSSLFYVSHAVYLVQNQRRVVKHFPDTLYSMH